MREILTDLVRQTAGLFDAVKITGTEAETKLQAVDTDKTLFLNGAFNLAVPAFEGEFGISNLSLLNGVLNFASYRTDESRLEVVRKARKNSPETVDYFRFEDAKGEGVAIHRAMSAELLNDQVVFREVPWNITVTPQKAKIAEFSQLANLYKEVDRSFAISTQKGNLFFSIGSEDSTSHRGAMVFEHGVDGSIKSPLAFNTEQFLGVLKVAGNNPVTISFFEKGLLMITVQSPLATYHFYMRAKS